MNKSSATREVMRRWKIARTEHLETLIRDKLKMSDSAFRQLLCRLRADRHIYTSYLPDQTVHFDRSAYRRWKFLEELPESEQEKFISRSGIEHNLMMLGLANQIDALFPDLAMIPNVLSEKSLSTFGVEDYREKHAPDFVCRSKSDDCSSYFYIEVERSLKEKGRYKRKWMAYEGDSSISSCFYWVSDKRILDRLVGDAQRFFSNGMAFGDFKLGFVHTVDFERQLADTPIIVCSSSGRAEKTLRRTFEEARIPREQKIKTMRGGL